MPKCIVDGCPNKQRRMRCMANFSLHGFPRTPEQIKLWLLSTGQDFGDIDKFVQCIRDSKKDNKYRLCSAHFTPQSYYTQGVRKCLKPYAVPSIFPKRNAPPPTTKEQATAAGHNTSVVNVSTSNGKPDTKKQGSAAPSTIFIDHDYASNSMIYKVNATAKCVNDSITGKDDANMDNQRTGKVLSHVLEIVYLLTGEVSFLKHLPKAVMKNIDLKQISKKILHQLMEIINLLNEDEYIIVKKTLPKRINQQPTGEVPLKCDDVAVYFSKEEWEYIEGHKELYKDVLVEKKQTGVTSGDSENVNSGPDDGKICTVIIKEETEEMAIQQVEITSDLDTGVTDGSLYKIPVKQEVDEERKENDVEQVEIQLEPDTEIIIPGHLNTGHLNTIEEMEEKNMQQVEMNPDLSSGLHDETEETVLINEEGEYERGEEDIQQLEIDTDLCANHSLSIDEKLDENMFEESQSQTTACILDGIVVDNASLHQAIQGKAHANSPKASTSCENETTTVTEMTASVDSQATHGGGKRYQCNECGKQFDFKCHLITHRVKHTGEKPHGCSECGKHFAYKHVLIAHQRIHTGEKPFRCNKCGKQFARRCQIVAHQISHTEVKLHRCNECGKQFACERYLIIHQRSHTGEKPHTCNECGKQFACKRYLTVHKKSHTDGQPHGCNECGKRFASKQYLLKHQRKKHQWADFLFVH